MQEFRFPSWFEGLEPTPQSRLTATKINEYFTNFVSSIYVTHPLFDVNDLREMVAQRTSVIISSSNAEVYKHWQGSECQNN